jgi:hypothetical protein
MRNVLIAAALFCGVSSHGWAQSSPSLPSAYDSLPIGRDAADSFLTPELQRQAPPEVMASISHAAPDATSRHIELANYDADCGDGILPPLGSESFWFGSVDLMMMTPKAAGVAARIDSESIVAPRGIVGWESRRNLGLRARFWSTTSESDVYLGGSGPIEIDLKPTRFDFDVYRRFIIDDSSLLIGAGVTAAEMEFEVEPISAFFDRGAGVQFFAEGRHRLTRSSIADTTLFARGRWAGLTGKWEAPSGTYVEGDSNMDILEAAIGVEWRRRFKTADLVLQYSMESQTWDATFTEHVGFIGSVFSIGFTR